MTFFLRNQIVKVSCIFAVSLLISTAFPAGYFWWVFAPSVIGFILVDTIPAIAFGLKYAAKLKSNPDEVLEAYYGYQMLRSYPDGMNPEEFRALVDGHRIAKKVSGGIVDYRRFR